MLYPTPSKGNRGRDEEAPTQEERKRSKTNKRSIEDVIKELDEQLIPLNEIKDRRKEDAEEAKKTYNEADARLRSANSAIANCIDIAARSICPHEIGDVVEMKGRSWRNSEIKQYVVASIKGFRTQPGELSWRATAKELTAGGKIHQGRTYHPDFTEAKPVVRKVQLSEMQP